MIGSNMLEILIGLIFIFILTSTICTAVREGIESILKTRAAYLEQGIKQLLKSPNGNTDLVKSFYDHPLISSLFNDNYTPSKTHNEPPILARGKNLPSYIPSKNFARALMDIATWGTETNKETASNKALVLNLKTMRANIGLIENPNVRRVLLNAIDISEGDINKAQINIENWYNSSMDRVSGWYKRSTQWLLFWIGLTVAVGLNINTLAIINYLSHDSEARQTLVKNAEAMWSNSSTPPNADNTNPAIPNSSNTNNPVGLQEAELQILSLPIGWSDGLQQFSDNSNGTYNPYNSSIGQAILGWLITAIAATLGAPFWFDILNRVMVIRSTVKPHEKSPEEASEDSRTKTSPNFFVAPDGELRGKKTDMNLDGENQEVDTCESEFSEYTADEELPESKGGVEK